MRTTFYRLLFLIAIVSICGLQGCQEKDDKFFTDTANLDGAIYRKLQEKGNFTNYLKCLDKTPYAAGLSKSGSWTVFVPDDEAFKAYLAANNYASVDAMPYDKISDIVKYSIVTDAYNTTTLTFYPNGWYAGNSCRRYTQKIDTIVEVDSKDYPKFQNWQDRTYKLDPRNGSRLLITYFLPPYLNARGVTPEDVNFMFPGQNYDGENPNEMTVEDAKVLEQNVIAENGLIYVLDKVLLPRENIYQRLRSTENTGKYTIFKNMVDRFGTFAFSYLLDNPQTGAQDSIFRLSFQTGITNNYPGYDINSESYPKLKANINYDPCFGVGMLVPTDAALTAYLNGNSLLAKYYTSFDEMPLDVIGFFLSNFYLLDFWDACAGHYANCYSLSYEKLDMMESNIVDKKWCSNGMFVGIDKVFTSSSFSTVLGPLLLDSTYTIMQKAVKDLQIDKGLKSLGINTTVIGLKNTQIVDMPDPNSPYRKVSVVGYAPDLSVIYMEVTGDPTAANNRIYPDPAAATPSTTDISYVNTTLQSIVKNQIIYSEVDASADNFYQASSGEFIRVTNNATEFAGGGDIDAGNTVTVDSKIETVNGIVYNMNGPVIRPTRYTYGALTDNADLFSMFTQVLDGCNAKVAISGYNSDFLIGFLDLRKSYTLLAPNNAAVQKAIDDNVIPNPDPNYLKTLSPLDLANAQLALLNFAKKHFIQRAFVTDGRNTEDLLSLYVDKIIDFIPIYREYTVKNFYSPMGLEISSATDGTLIAKTGSKINILSKMVVIHEIDSYLK